jgi:hypothetical protein
MITRLPQEKRDLKYPIYFMVTALLLLGIVFLTPYNGLSGRSFLAIAQATRWADGFDGLAVWCSMKIIFLSMAGIFFVLSIEEVLLFMRRISAANLLILTLLFPLMGILMGCYYVLKSIF